MPIKAANCAAMALALAMLSALDVEVVLLLEEAEFVRPPLL